MVPSLEVKNTLGLYVWDVSSMVIFPPWVVGRSSSLQLGVVSLFLHSFVYSWYTFLASFLFP